MADHATKNTTTSNLPGLTGERVKAGVTIVVTLYALVNAGLSLAGINPLPFTNEQVRLQSSVSSASPEPFTAGGRTRTSPARALLASSSWMH